MISSELRVEWSLSAWELSIERRGELGEIDRFIFGQHIRKIQRALPDLGIDLSAYHHLAAARPFIEMLIEDMRHPPYGLGRIHAPILLDSFNNLLEGQGYSIQMQVFQSVRGPR